VPFESVAELVGTSPAGSAPDAPTSLLELFPGGKLLPPQPSVLVALLAVPFAWMLLQAAVFSGHGMLGPFLVIVLGFVAAIILGRTSWRQKTLWELARIRPVAIALAVVFVGGEGWGVVGGIIARARYAPIATALAMSDPCAVESLNQDDLKEFASNEGQKQAKERMLACEGAKEAARQAQDAADKAKKQADACAKLVAAIDRGDTIMPDVNNPTTTAVAQRLAAKAVVQSDLELSKPDLACGDAMWTRVVNAAAGTPVLWGRSAVPRPSDDMAASLAKVGLSPDVQNAVRIRVESAAAAVLNKKATKDMVDAKEQCDHTLTLHVDLGPSCGALEKKYATIDAKEDAALKAQANREAAVEKAKAEREAAVERRAEAAQEAKERRCQTLKTAQDKCLYACMDLDPLSAAADACTARCDARFPTSGCD
jgi:hypothetical protein